MSKASAKDSDLLPEYDFSKGLRGKYAARYRAGTNLIILDPDLVERFPDSEAVNRALRTLVEVADRQVKSPPR
ncbi:MAG TPA: hypothetical protein VN851_26030 [Thermoanaerobaculia bacterium]|nr:hypothetical protein [Thermoanaerobaculia bacterium]